MRNVSFAVLSIAAAGTLGAQTPAPPPLPRPPARVIPPRLAPAPPVPWDFDFEFQHELRANVEALRASIESEMVRGRLEELKNLDFGRIQEMSLRALDQFELKGFDRPFIWGGDRELRKLHWARPQQGTPEDSLYRQAREALNRGEYGRAASLFQSLAQKFPRSRFAPTAMYYESFSLYRSGSTENLRTALEALRSLQEKHPEKAADADVGALRTRVYAALAARGDASAAAALRAATSTGPSCDEEDMEVRAEALNALTQLDPENAAAALKRVLARRDECSVALRRRAVYLLGRTGTEQSVNDLLDAARTDPDPSVRSDAISQLGRSSVASVNSRVLLQIFNSAEDERTRQAVLSALRSKGGPESRAALRTILERSDLPERIRAQAIQQLAGYRYLYVPAVSVTPEAPISAATAIEPARLAEHTRTEPVLEEEDAAFLRTLYPKTDSRTIKSAIISVIARTGGSTNDHWLMGIVRNGNEDSSLRGEALSRMRSLSIEDLGKLYEGLTERAFRAAIVRQLSSREEVPATEKLIDIAKTSTDPSVRNRAIQALTQRSKKGDSRAVAFIRELVERP